MEYAGGECHHRPRSRGERGVGPHEDHHADGRHLVITDENGTVRWSSHTEGTRHKAVFQDDGHFVVYTEGNGTAWSSGTAGNPGAQLMIQADGNVVIESRRRPVVAGTQH
ncbi:hypothetical protein [Streptomyces shenzhenensis]|uniref:hypothetical protein n=1 Tax=Streptomyces shenzhenensis TaxID=943815 RepID=UPI001F3B2194|nr:hypothetical protein [Streptomyces shenzhenensis]